MSYSTSFNFVVKEKVGLSHGMAGGLGWDGVSETGVDDINEVSA